MSFSFFSPWFVSNAHLGDLSSNLLSNEGSHGNDLLILSLGRVLEGERAWEGKEEKVKVGGRTRTDIFELFAFPLNPDHWERFFDDLVPRFEPWNDFLLLLISSR